MSTRRVNSHFSVNSPLLAVFLLCPQKGIHILNTAN